jgi:hypothetical protein
LFSPSLTPYSSILGPEGAPGTFPRLRFIPAFWVPSQIILIIPIENALSEARTLVLGGLARAKSMAVTKRGDGTKNRICEHVFRH